MNNIHTTKVVAVFIAAAALMLSATQVRAENCSPNYGGGETCDRDAKLRVDKEIWNPEKKAWVDNISSKDYMFDAKDEIKFRIIVRNAGDMKITDINLEDQFPSYVRYLKGDGEGKNDDEKATFDEFSLEPGKSKTFEFYAKVAGSDILPKDSKICLTNIAEAEGEVNGDNDNKEEASDNAKFCIDLPNKKKEKITRLPTTGFDFGLLGLSSGLVLVGFGIRKLTE
jgi:uncharacterized repeat protein (TIGR01451 family)